MTKWFYHSNQIVKGPVSTEELQQLIPSLVEPRSTFIWSRGQTNWVPADRWQPIDEQATREIAATAVTAHRANLSPQNEDAINTSITVEKPNFALTAVPQDEEKTAVTSDEKYRVQLNFVDQPLMTKDELMDFASRAENPSLIAIYDSTTKEWKEIYTFKDIVEKLGLTRRKHPRVPILAQFNGQTSRHEQFTARLVTISIGGLGVTDVYDLKIGDTITGQITSPHFYSPVAISAEVTYSGNDGYVGFKFTQISDESQSLVTNYVKRFSHNQ